MHSAITRNERSGGDPPRHGRLNRWLIVACALVVVVAFPLQKGTAQPATTPIRIGVVNTDVSSEPVYADAEGLFTRAGLAAAITTFPNGKQVLDGLTSGALDVGFVNIVSAVDALQKGAQLTIVAPAAVYDPSAPITVLVQAATSNFASGQDLNGKTLGVPAPNDLGEVSTRAWIDATGGDSRTVHYVTGIPASQIAAALADHRLDAAELSEPALTAEKQKGRIKPLAATFDIVGAPFYIGVFVASRPWSEAHPAAARAFSAVMRDTARWANAHRAETAEILAARLGISPAATASMVRARYGDVLSPALIQPILDLSARYGALRPARAADLIGAAAVHR
jgi:sulfonate transport system substrate-binding protein